MPKKHHVKCRYCPKGFNVPVGEFPKALFKHMGKKHKAAMAKRAGKKGKKASRSHSKGGKTVNTTTGGYSKLTLTFHN